MVSTSLPARLSSVHSVLPPPSFPLPRFLPPPLSIPTGHHCLNFTASGTWSWSKQLPQERLLFGRDGLPRQQFSSGWLLNVPLGLLLFICFPSARLQRGGQTKAEPVNVTKLSYVNIMEQDLPFLFASKHDFSRQLLQP